MFGSEQSLIETSSLRRYITRIFGELHYGIRVRSWYIREALDSVTNPSYILDAGCGSGQTTFLLARIFPDAWVEGIDLNPRLVARCQEIARQGEFLNVRFMQGDLLDSLREKPYDLVICQEVLEHIRDYQTVLSNLCHAVARGGTLILHTPAKGPYQSESFGYRRFRRGLKKREMTNDEAGTSHVRSGFSVSALTSCMAAQSMSHIKIRHTFGYLGMIGHTLFELYRGSSLMWNLLFAPIVFSVAALDYYLPKKNGGGILLVATKGN